MEDYWHADDAFFALLRDKQVLTRIVAEVAGETVAAANANEKTKTMKRIVRDHLDGTNGRQQIIDWVPLDDVSADQLHRARRCRDGRGPCQSRGRARDRARGRQIGRAHV